MALRGKGMLVVLCEVEARHREDLDEWYNREHIEERIAIPGLQRGRRYANAAGTRSLALYECDKVGDLASPAYVRKLSNGSAWTRRISKRFTSFRRLALHIRIDLTYGDGGVVACLRFVPDPRQGTKLLAWLRTALPRLLRRPGVVGAVVGIDDPAIVHAPARAQGRDVPANEPITWAILLEGSNEAAIQAAAAALFTATTRKRFGIPTAPDTDLYRFTFGNQRR